MIASANSDEIDEDSLHLFFENDEVGGGEVESIERLGDSYKMIFADIEGMIRNGIIYFHFLPCIGP